MLTPALIVLSIYELARRFKLPARHAAFAAVGAGVLPAITTVHVETFFSQALAIPVLLILPCFVFDLAEQFTWKRLLGGALILAAGTTIYTEFHVIFLGLVGLIFGFEWVKTRKKLISYAFSAFSLVGVSLALNIGFIYHVYDIFNRLTVADILAGIYPWAFSLDGISRLWLGDVVLALQSPGWLPLFYQTGSLVLLLIAYLGLSFSLWKQRDGLTISIAALAFLPVAIRIQGTQYPYQFYKLLLSVSPLLLLGLAAFVHTLEATPLKIKLPARVVSLGMVGLVILLCICTESTTIVGGIFPFGIRSIGAASLLAPGARQAQDMLSQLKGQSILIVNDDYYMNGWLAYFSRHNRVWLTNPRMSDIDIAGVQVLDDLPDNILVLTTSANGGIADSSIRPVWSADPYHLGQITGQGWALPVGIQNVNGVEDWGGETGFWLGEGESAVDVLSSKGGQAAFTAEFSPGPSLPDVPGRRITIGVGQTFSLTTTIPTAGLQSFTIPIVAGLNHISLRALDKATVQELPSGDARALILGIRGLRIKLGERK